MQDDDDFGFYHAKNLDMIALCALMLEKYHIPPSVTLAQDKYILSDVLTLLRLWNDEADTSHNKDVVW